MTNVNYSASLLHEEYDERAPVREALRLFATEYSVRHQDVVELGSGLGHNLKVFIPENRVVGIEGLPTAAAEATAGGVRTIAADLGMPVPFDSSSFDVALCLDVLEHLLEPERCLREAWRLLRPGGLLAVNVPNHFTLSCRWNILRGGGIDSARFFPDHADWSNPHIRFFRHASIVQLLERCGFRIQADWSRRFPSIPLLSRLRATRSSRAAQTLASRFPDLLAGGFFLISRRIP